MTRASARPWLKNYPAGVPAEIDASQFSSVGDMVKQTCKRYASLPAFSNMGYVLSFSAIDQASDEMAVYLQVVMGLKKGDRIVIQMPNLLQYPIALFGAIKAGLIVVNTNPLYTPTEMLRNFEDSGAVAIIILENFADKLEAIIAKTSIKHVILTQIGDAFPGPKRILTNFVVKHVKKMVPAHRLRDTVRYLDALALGKRAENQRAFVAPQLTHDDLVFLQYTGGTTGVSKGAELTHGNILNNLMQMMAWFKPKLAEGQETMIAALPLYHVSCLTVNCFGVFVYGNHNVLITNPRDLKGFIKILSQVRPTAMTVVSTLVAGLLNHPDFDSFDASTLKLTMAGGMALKGSVAEEWTRRTKTLIVEGYGLTEASPVVSCNPLDGTDRLGTIGLPLSSTEVILLGEDGKEVKLGEAGELCVRGPQVMRGYWKQPEETRNVIDSDSWLHTGDIAMMDQDGFFKIVDRKKDMILVSGFNVYPNEIEDVIMRHPKVLECAAIGAPDEHSGEVVKVVVVKRSPDLTPEEIQSYCRDYLTSYKLPRFVEFRAELPKTNVGKILRRELR